MCWWVFTGLTHMILEGYFVFSPEFFKQKNPTYLAEVCDSRYVGRDSAVIAVEGRNAVLEGPACILAAYAILFIAFLTLAMVIVGWHEGGSIFGIFEEDVIKSILSIFITYAVLNFIQATLDIILSFSTWGSLNPTQILRYLLKFIIATFWVVIFPICY
ncbi:putative emopamil-binding protein [Helianthus anomalus]